MEGLNILLPPFSPDYSGVAAVFYELNCLAVLHDAAGCTSNYASFDEPRWYGSRKAIYSSGLREIDAVMGNDDKLIRRMIDAAELVKPDVIAAIGSPVPMIIGTDFTGIANELEAVTNIPSFGFNTTGLKFYNEGVSMAFMALAKRFMKKQTQVLDRSVNILGLTPLDFGHKTNVANMKAYLESENWHVIASLMMDTTLEKVKEAPSASVNLVVSQSGLQLAKWMERKFQIPYVVGTPIAKSGRILEALEKASITKESQCMVGDDRADEVKILWIGEQVLGNSLRNCLEDVYSKTGMVIGCPFGKDETLARSCDVALLSEREIVHEMNREEYQLVIADPLLKKALRKNSKAMFFEVPQVAVSSKLYWDRGFSILGEDMTKLINSIISCC